MKEFIILTSALFLLLTGYFVCSAIKEDDGWHFWYAVIWLILAIWGGCLLFP